jgi:hypothetical protein
MRTKHCSKCNKDSLISKFHKKSSESDGLQPYCKSCQKAYESQYYKRNSERIIKMVRANKRQRALLHYRRILDEYFSHGCVRCRNRDSRVLEFDHVSGVKTSVRGTEGVMSYVREGYSWKRIEDEIKKCVVLCSNCHRIKTYIEGNYWKDLTYECGR